MGHLISEEDARTTYSRGLVTRLILRFSKEKISPHIINEAFSKRSGFGVKSLERVARRIQKRSGCVYCGVENRHASPVLSVILRYIVRNSEGQYASSDVIFEQDTLRYIHRRIAFKADSEIDMDIVITRHAIERWIQRGGAADPRDNLDGKIDRAVMRMFLKYSLQDCISYSGNSALRDRRGEVPRFGIPDATGGIWLAGVAGYFADKAEHGGGGNVRHRRAIYIITYLGASDLSLDQCKYLDAANSEGITSAISRMSDAFTPRIY